MNLELKNDLNQGGNSNGNSRNDAPVIVSDNRSFVNELAALSFLETFDLLPNYKSDGSGIRIQDVSRRNNKFIFSKVATSPLEIGFVSSSDCVSAGSHTNGNRKVTTLGFQNQTSSSVEVDNILDADLDPAKRVSDLDGFFGYFYAGFEKKNNYNPGNNQVERERTQEGNDAVHVVVESSYQSIDQNHTGSTDQRSNGSVLEILHNLSLSEEEVG